MRPSYLKRIAGQQSHNADVMRHCVFFITAAVTLLAQDPYRVQRERMVHDQIESRGVKNSQVLKAMRDTHRHFFVPPDVRRYAYQDYPIPIGFGQTISQPYIVGFMTQMLDLNREHRVLEIGTGSGYQAAILSSLAKEVYTIEIVPQLARSAAETLRRLGHENVFVREGDGYKGWPEKAPFDRIILTASPPELPQTLVDQLRPGGKLLAPVGSSVFGQEIILVQKAADGKITKRPVLPVRFVPMVKPAVP
jgi:protein-L-isoaspartate(D-aspartate) O-methyltransferase